MSQMPLVYCFSVLFKKISCAAEKKAEGKFTFCLCLCKMRLAFFCERFTIRAFTHGWIAFMCSYCNAVKRTVVLVIAVIFAL